jgi:hypothetical protein
MRAKVLAATVALLACSGPRYTMAEPERPARAGPYSLEVVDEAGAVLPTFWHHGRTYVLGALRQRYLLRVRNGSARRVEVVVSVDGRDVVDGRPASWEKRGYLVEPHGEVTIDGYRLSTESVGAFRFSSVPRSYASRMGDARDVGVIGAAIFPERARHPAPLATPRAPRPGDLAERGAPEPGEATAGAAPQSAPGGKAFRGERREDRPGLGTELAEEHGSRVYEARFERARARPDAVLTLRYDDRAGLAAAGVDVDRWGYRPGDEAWVRESAQPFRGSPFAEPPPGWHPW